MSQDGSTTYPFSENQVRTMGRVKIEHTFLLDENKNLKEMMEYCDSVAKSDSLVIIQYMIQIRVKNDMLDNREDKHDILKLQLNNCADQVKRERRKKFLYLGTTVGALSLLVLGLFVGG